MLKQKAEICFENEEKPVETIGIRADMNPTVATGHIMRCLSVADAIVGFGKKVVFFTADDYPSRLLEQRGYESIILDSDWQKMEQEIPQLLNCLEIMGIKKILVDSYRVTAKYLQALKDKVEVSYIDDLDAFTYPVDRLICYANYYPIFSYGNQSDEAGYCLGMKYVPLRDVFQNAPVKVIKDRIEKILLLSGGSDSYGILEQMVEIFKDNQDVELTVVCGRFYENYERLVEKYKDYSNLVFLQNISNIEAYMAEADLAISAGGTTLYELCALGVPTISYSFVDNQLDTVYQFEKDGLIAYAGDVRNDDIFTNVLNLYEEYNNNKALRENRSFKMQQMVDGKGATRIAKAII